MSFLIAMVAWCAILAVGCFIVDRTTRGRFWKWSNRRRLAQFGERWRQVGP